MFGTILSIAGTVIGAMNQSDSAENASAAQGQASQAAIDEQRRQYDQSRTDLEPWRRAGGAAVSKLSEGLGLGAAGGIPSGAKDIDTWSREAGYDMPQGRGWNAGELAALQPAYQAYLKTVPAAAPTAGGVEPGSLLRKFTLADFWDDPVTKASYQMGLDQGIKAIGNRAGAAGSRNSGATIKAATRFANDYTGQQAAGSQGRYVSDQTNTYNRLAGLAGTGQTAANTVANLGANTATNVGNIMSAQGNARGAAAIAGGNAMAGAGNTIGNWWQQQQMLNRLMPQQNAQPAYAGWGGSTADPWYG